MGIAAVARIATLLVMHNFSNPEIWEWGVITRNMLAGKGFSYHEVGAAVVPSAYMPPAYSYFLLVMFTIFGDNSTAYILTQFLQAAFGVILVYLVYKVTLVGWDERMALVAAAITAIYPPFVYMPAEMHSISFYIVITVAATYFIYLYCTREPLLHNVVYAALLLGVLMYFRAEALALPFLFAAVIVLTKKANWRRATVLLVVPMFCLAPWIIRNYGTFGRLIPTTTAGGISLWFGHNSQATGSQREPWPSGRIVMPDAALMQRFDRLPADSQYEIRMSDIYRQEALRFARTHPGREVVLAGKKMFYFWTIDWNHPKARHVVYWLPTLAFVGLFFVGAFREGRRYAPPALAPHCTILFTNLLAVVFFVLPRYRLAVEPLMVPFAAAAFLWAREKWTARVEDRELSRHAA